MEIYHSLKSQIARIQKYGLLITSLVDLDVPLLGLLQSLEPLVVVKILLFGNSLQHVLDSRHHALKTAEVDVSTVIQLFENFVGVFLDLVLDVHLSARLVLLFTRKSIVDTEVFGELLLGLLELVIIKKGVAVCDTKEQPSFSLVGLGGRGVFGEQTTDKSTVRSNSSSGGNHDVISGGVFFGHKHNLSGGSSHHNFRSGLGVAKEVGADTLLGGIVSLEFRVPVSCPTDTKGSGLSGHVVTVSRRGDRVKTDRVGFSILLSGTRGHDTPRLSLPVREVTTMVDDDVVSLTSGLGSNNLLGGDNLSGERGLVLVHVDRNSGLIIVGFSLKEVLSSDLRAKIRK
jgi:hypothetical protein